MKYRPSEALARHAGELLVEAFSSLEINPDWDFIVPMPISGESLKTRLFNQSLTIARKVAKRTATPVVSSILNHHGKHLSQTTLLHKERIRNVEGSFTVQGNILSGKRLLLIDDVLTTGATAGAATSALLTAGADSVDVITLARSHAWTEWRYRIHRSFRV